ncbi:MAG: four helix bundle protein [Gammaproteobacteria bacterium]|nr:four helix bundle protein [Gammaproteobacteria bacterium]
MRFEDMDVWKWSSRLSVEIYRHLVDLKDFSFKDQITRSGLSIPGNIVEGFGRATDKDKRNFLNYAKGSCAELRAQIYIGIEIGYISSVAGKNWIKETNGISAMLTSLMKYLRC